MALDKMDENDWKYHGEGNKSLVVSHVQVRVLTIFPHLFNTLANNRNVMKPLLGEKYVHSGEVVKLPLDFVRQLSLKVQQERPELRCDKVMDTFSGCGLCLPNLTHLSPCHFGDHRPPLCVEIKPKCGFLPFSRHVTKECKRKVCRFCMHQHFKVILKCFFFFVSRSKQRMFVAIKHLLEEPQNNLKIFKGGELIYSCKDDAKQQPDLNELVQHLWPYFHHSNGLYNGHQSSKAVFNEFIQVICGALLGSGDSSRSGEPRKVQLAESRSVCEASPLHRELLRSGNHGLPKDSVLAKILQVQMLDNLDIEGVYPLYKRVEQYLEEFPKERNRLQVDGPYDEGFLEKVKTCPSEDDGSIEYAVGKVLQYRVAMTAKDCSIMITFAPCGEDEKLQANLEIQPPKPRFTYSVSILDLDPKPYDSIPHQYKLDSKIVNYYLRSTTSAQDLPTSNHYKDRQDCTLLFHPV
uniref:Inositol-pentakisphosphate 2-kinase n=1 Tax=Astyanax mexicanus TaxID=7994 RepID=A0A8B9JED0_ASTMX